MTPYDTLTHIYYTAPEQYEDAYRRRFDAPFACHFPIAIRQYHRPRSYPAFFNYTGHIALLTESIDRHVQQFLSLVRSVPPVVLQQFSLLSILDEVKSTNDIEGVHSTRKEIRDILDGIAPHARMESIVHKYAGLMRDDAIFFHTAADIRRFFDDFAHSEIIKDRPEHQLDGRLFRKDPVSIESAAGKVIHQGLFPESDIIEAMEEALSILHSPDMPLLIRLSLFHYFFAYIHPFYDGNGRTARFITSYFISKNYHRLLALRLSVYIKKNRPQYYKLFAEADSALNRGDMTPFVIGFLTLILGTIDDTTALLYRKKEQLTRYEKKISALHLHDALANTLYFIFLQAALCYGRGVTMQQLMDLTRKSRGTIQKRIDAIPADHLIMTHSNKSHYYKLNLRLFA